MYRFFRTTKFFFLLAIGRGFDRHTKRFPRPSEEVKSNPVSRTAGRLYRKFAIDAGERHRVRRFNRESNMREHRILGDIFKLSHKLLAYILIVTIVVTIVDYLASFFLKWLMQFGFLRQVFDLPSTQAISDGLVAYITAITALLGLIFALYAVGFQLTTDRYSEKVTTFINNERVGSYFFQFLIFTDLMAIVDYLKLNLLAVLPVASFGVVTMFVALSLLGVILFKSHYLEAMKPQSMLRNLLDLVQGDIEVVSEPTNYKQKSWSIATQTRRRARKNFGIIEALYRDLTRKDIVRGENWDDASVAPLVVGQIMQRYTDRKRYIDTEKPWWSVQQYKRVGADNLTMFSIKTQHELRGIGPLYIPETNPNWFEDMVLGFCDELERDISKEPNQLLFANIAEGYKLMLVGDKQEQDDAPPKTIPGAWQNQEMYVFDKAVRRLVGLWHKVDISNSRRMTDYLNCYFSVASELIEPWDIKQALEIAGKFYKDQSLNRSQAFMNNTTLPAYTRKLLQNYWQKLEVEQLLEGRLLTPKTRLLSNVEKDLNDEHARLMEQYLGLFFDDSSEIIEILASYQKYDVVAQFIKMQMEWVSHLLYNDNKDMAEKFSPKIKDNLKYLLLAPKEVLEEEELLEQVEKGFFVALLDECKTTFVVYAEAAAVVRVKASWQEQNQDKLFRELRLPLIWGSMAFALSELRQDSYWVKTFTIVMEKTTQEGAFTHVMEVVRDNRLTRNIVWETTRYLNWQQAMMRKISKDLRQVPSSGRGEIGFGMVFDHPSKFIQGLADFPMMFDDRAMRGYVEWLQKRAALREILELILGRQNGQ